MFDETKNPPPRGLIDRLIRRFSFAAWVICILCLYSIAAVAIGLAVAPGLWLWSRAHALVEAMTDWQAYPILGVAFGVAFFASAFSLIVVVPLFNLVLPTRLKPFRGGYYTIATLPWFVHNALFYLVRYTVLPFFTLTPFSPWFLRAMGMRIGKNAYINTEQISDPRLITVGDDTVIGGSVSLFAHHGGGGHFVIAPVEIGARVTIGQKATVMGGVVIGDGAVILPHTVLLPGTRVGAGETWSGVPGQKVER